jgi:hyperosmotically inducible protein
MAACARLHSARSRRRPESDEQPNSGRVLEKIMKHPWNTFGVIALGTCLGLATPLSAQEAVKDAAVKTGDAVAAGARTVAKKTKDGLSKTGEVMTDSWITSRVSARFVGEDLLKDSNINVDTDQHVVTLKGTVVSAAGRRRATSVAKGTEGVRRVVNQLDIAAKKG